MRIRVKFAKHGPIRFIGHLDVMRYFQKTIRRAGIDVSYSGGFSPHQIMSFASPLGVGLESNGEYMDIEVNSLTSCQDMMDRLNEVSVPGIRVLDVKILPNNAGNAMASVAAAEYTVRFREGRTPGFFASHTNVEIHKALGDYCNQEMIAVTKEGKKGLREVDIKPGIYELSWDKEELHMLVDASSAGNIKPVQIVDTFLDFVGESPAENALLITREETYTRAENGVDLIPLNAVGNREETFLAESL